MITFPNPWALWALLAVAAVAAVALFRPDRLRVRVGSLELWRGAIGAAAARHTRKRNVSLAWVLLLLGAVAGVLAAGRMTVTRGDSHRRIAIRLYPSAELSGEGGREDLQRSAVALLGRLGPEDRVALVLPIVLDAEPLYRPVAEARAAVGGIPILPIPASQLELPPPPDDAQAVFTFMAAAADVQPLANETRLSLPPHLPPVTFDAFAAEPLPDASVQVFAAVRNHTARPWAGRIAVFAYAGTQGERNPLAVEDISVPPRGRAAKVLRLPDRRPLPEGDHWIQAVLTDDAANGDASVPGDPLPGFGTEAYLVRSEARRAGVALLGRDSPLLRRYVSSDPLLTPVAGVERAELVIANGVDPPPAVPAIVIDPPAPPAGASPGEPRAAVVLDDASLAPDDPVTRGVDLRGVAVRTLKCWRKADADATAATLTPLIRLDDCLLAVRSGQRARGEPPRVYLSFALDPENTNLSTRDAFVVLLANAARWCLNAAGQTGGADAYHAMPPLEAVALLPRSARSALQGAPPDRVPRPGAYLLSEDSASVAAVSLTGLGGDGRVEVEGSLDGEGDRGGAGSLGGDGGPPPDPLSALRAAPLPAPQPAGRSHELTPWLGLLAVLLWLGGWWARLR